MALLALSRQVYKGAQFTLFTICTLFTMYTSIYRFYSGKLNFNSLTERYPSPI
jgi:hypothetical protein